MERSLHRALAITKYLTYRLDHEVNLAKRNSAVVDSVFGKGRIRGPLWYILRGLVGCRFLLFTGSWLQSVCEWPWWSWSLPDVIITSTNTYIVVLLTIKPSSCSKAVYKPVWHIPLLNVQWITPDDGQRNCPKHVEFHSKIKFEKIRVYIWVHYKDLSRCTVTCRDARSHECNNILSSRMTW
jgi:hypothetical protein